jgi:type I restriction enzyme M protein
VPLQEIQDNKYDLSINRYKEVVYEEKTYEKPTTIITQIEALDKERQDLLKQLKTMRKRLVSQKLF